MTSQPFVNPKQLNVSNNSTPCTSYRIFPAYSTTEHGQWAFQKLCWSLCSLFFCRTAQNAISEYHLSSGVTWPNSESSPTSAPTATDKLCFRVELKCCSRRRRLWQPPTLLPPNPKGRVEDASWLFSKWQQSMGFPSFFSEPEYKWTGPRAKKFSWWGFWQAQQG